MTICNCNEVQWNEYERLFWHHICVLCDMLILYYVVEWMNEWLDSILCLAIELNNRINVAHSNKYVESLAKYGVNVCLWQKKREFHLSTS